jgi:RNA polymerase sigma-70 factor (ECF subfamily)
MTLQDRQECFQTLIDAHRGILFKVCNTYCRGHDDREDLAQEIVVQLWRSFPRFDERFRFSTWMYRIALNVAISFYRRESTRARYVITADTRLLEVADEHAGISENLALLHQAIATLDPLNKALALLYVDGHSHRDIGEVLGITESNVGTRLDRLKRRLREELNAGGLEPKGT